MPNQLESHMTRLILPYLIYIPIVRRKLSYSDSYSINIEPYGGRFSHRVAKGTFAKNSSTFAVSPPPPGPLHADAVLGPESADKKRQPSCKYIISQKTSF